MKIKEIWRKVSNRPEHAIVAPIRLDYSMGERDEPGRPVHNAIAKKGEASYRGAMESLVCSVFGGDKIVRHDSPATVIDVVETGEYVGHYGSRAVATALFLRFDIVISRPGIGKEVMAKKVFDVRPPEHIGAPGRYVGDVSGGFPRQEIETWLRSFPFRSEE